MSHSAGRVGLLDRRSETATFDRLIGDARSGRSGAIVVRGEAGIGKTALLAHVIESAPDMRLVRATGVASEMELAFAALHQLCAPLLDRLDRLPSPQRAALEVTFGLSEGAVPDRFFVGLAVLSLLSEVGEERPLLCVVDDAQWLDGASAQVLAFVARRLVADPVVMIFAVREGSEELRGIPELLMEGLQEGDARQLLRSVVHGPLDDRVREQVVAETGGNPLALLELTRGLSQAQLAAGFGFANALSVAGRVEERFTQRLVTLPDDSQRLLLLATVEPTGDPALLWKAAERCGIARSALAPAEAAGLFEVGTAVRFRHPLVRSAVYGAASSEQRRDAHRAVAEVTDADLNPDRRAWHRAEATAGPDEDVAAELERSAGRAHARGGFAAAAALLERAVALTPEASARGNRALAAAQAKVLSGAVEAAEGLLATAAKASLSDAQKAQADRIRAQLAYIRNRGNDAAPLLLAAAKRLEPVAPELARATYVDALSAAMFAGNLAAPGGSMSDVLQTARSTRPRASDVSELFFDGLSATLDQGYAAGAPVLREALEAVQGTPTDPQRLSGPAHMQEGYGYLAALYTWDEAAAGTISDRWARLCRETGSLSDLPLAITAHALMLIFAGDLDAAATLAEELRAFGEATGLPFGSYITMALAAFRGDEADGFALIAAAIRDAAQRGEGQCVAAGEWATALLDNGLGRYERALSAALRAGGERWELVFSHWAMPEVVEAAARSGRIQDAEPALTRLAAIADATKNRWATGIEARSRALVSTGDVAETLYQEAIQRLDQTRMRVELARAHLLYGEWLRRERRRREAREQLATAYEMFTIMGVGAFARRAERELLATGEHVSKRTVESPPVLTAQEARIARMARDGVSNAEIAARLFISRRTVEYHLSKVFNKLDVSSRQELVRVLPAEPSSAAPS